MKKVLSILLVMVMLLSLASCGSSEGGEKQTSPDSQDQTYNNEADGSTTPDVESTEAPVSQKLDNPLGLKCAPLVELVNAIEEGELSADLFANITSFEMFNESNEGGLVVRYVIDEENHKYGSVMAFLDHPITISGQDCADLWEDLSRIQNLQALTLSELGLDGIDGLSDHPELSELLLYGNNITDITVIGGLTKLINLNIEDNQVSDISPLANCEKLFSIRASNNQITDISALVQLPKLEYLIVDNNQITDVSCVPDFQKLSKMTLYLVGNPIEDTSILEELLSREDLEYASIEY